MKTDRAKMERLWSEFADQIGGFLRSRVGDATAAEDIRQDVFLRLQQRIHAGDSIRDLRAWLYRVARNMTIDFYRTRKATVDFGKLTLIEEPSDPIDLDPLWASFRRMIHGLPDGYREAVLLADIEQLPQREVADRLGVSLSAAKSRIHRGRKLLRENLDRCCQFERDRRGAVIDCTPRPTGNCVEC